MPAIIGGCLFVVAGAFLLLRHASLARSIKRDLPRWQGDFVSEGVLRAAVATGGAFAVVLGAIALAIGLSGSLSGT